MIGAVLDTNVLVSAAIKGDGIPAQILTQAEEKFVLLTSEYILEETAGVLARKHIQSKYRSRVTATRRRDFMTELRDAAVVVEVKTVVSAVSKDLRDNPVLACAMDGSAKYVVTGDKHLLDLGTYEGIRFITPAQFRSILREENAKR